MSSQPKLEIASKRFDQLRSLLVLTGKQRTTAVIALAQSEGVSERTVYRWLENFQNNGLGALAREPRKDQGILRIPAEVLHIITQALVSNPPSTPEAMIYRTLLRAVPEVMTYERGGKPTRVSLETVRRIKRRLLDDPHTRLLFHDVDKRKEHLRTYAGEVFAAHANDLWQMDMTRCDTMVCDPESGKIFRPRIHAIIDVYSGCIPGLAFALEEDQAQTDLAILRALVPKPSPYTDAWPIFGIPKRMYWDNGKTYGSEHARRVLSELGVEVVYSRPRA